MTTCPDCTRPLAEENGHGADGNGCTCPECLAMCWAEWGTPCQPVDWRARCLAAESVVGAVASLWQLEEATLEAIRAEALKLWQRATNGEAAQESAEQDRATIDALKAALREAADRIRPAREFCVGCPDDDVCRCALTDKWRAMAEPGWEAP